MYKIIRKLLFCLAPEAAHRLAGNFFIWIYRLRLSWVFPKVPKTPVRVMGMEFPNPVGLAAGFDKNGKWIAGLAALGFGFIEVGTVTPKAQRGNPRPRLFRLPEHRALINRLGLNNKGVDAVRRNIQSSGYQGILGVSISKNNDTPYEKALEDYLYCFRRVYALADYIALDVSCPNVPNFRDYLAGENFVSILKGVKAEQKKLKRQYDKYTPLVAKVSPDLSEDEIKVLAGHLNRFGIDAVIATNTTTSRPLNHPLARERGGLSGDPLFPLTLNTLKLLKKYLSPEIPVIAVGGIDTREKARQVFAAGANLAQVYTGFIYQGPRLLREVVSAYKDAHETE